MGRRVFGFVLVGLVLSACGGSASDTTTNEPATEPTSGIETTVAVATTTTEPVATVQAPQLGDTSWNVTDYRLPDGTITNVWKTEVTIAFAADGTFTGSAGCNDYEGTWNVAGDWNEFESGVPDPDDGQELILGSLSRTERACEDEAIMEQETEILDILQTAGRWVLIDGNFNLRDAEGSFLFEAEPV
jgi:heat shock protein HslJ